MPAAPINATQNLFRWDRLSMINHSRGFSLLELAIVIGILGMILAGLLRPLAARMELKAINAERDTLIQFEHVLVGYAMSEGHLPIPDGPTLNGSKVEGLFPFETLGIVNVSGKEYRYVVEEEFVHPTQPGVPGPTPDTLDMTDGTGVNALELSVNATVDSEVTRELPGLVVIERLVRAGQLP